MSTSTPRPTPVPVPDMLSILTSLIRRVHPNVTVVR